MGTESTTDGNLGRSWRIGRLRSKIVDVLDSLQIGRQSRVRSTDRLYTRIYAKAMFRDALRSFASLSRFEGHEGFVELCIGNCASAHRRSVFFKI